MDFFASDVFLTALARNFYQAKNYSFKIYEVGGYYLRLVSIDDNQPIISAPFYDYVRPLSTHDPAVPGSTTPLRFAPKVLTATVELDQRDIPARALTTGQEPAPMIDWGRFAAWSDYEAFLRGRSKSLLSLMRRRRNQLFAALGESTFSPEDQNPMAFELLCEWKSKQYEGGHEDLNNPRAVAMLRTMFEEGHLIVSSLKAGDQYLALSGGFRWEGRYLNLLMAYNPEFPKFALGNNLLMRMLEHNYMRGDTAYDFLQGAEAYKLNFATHVQVIEPVGTPPLAARIRSRAEKSVKAGLVRISPAAFYRVKSAILAARRLRYSLSGSNRDEGN